jgi:hypothetical protein
MRDLILAHIWLLDLCSYKSGVTELEDLKAKVRATEESIQDEKNLIACSKQEAEDLTA